MLPNSKSHRLTSTKPETADRSLEDLDRYFREEPSLLVFRNKDAISSHRPAAYIEHERDEVRRNSSIAPGDLSKAAETVRMEQLGRLQEEKMGYGGNGVEAGNGDERVERTGDIEKGL